MDDLHCTNTLAQAQRLARLRVRQGEDEMFPIDTIQSCGDDGERICLNLYRVGYDTEAALFLNLGYADAERLAALLLQAVRDRETGQGV